MAIYHLEAKMITRSIGRSAVAASAYMSCSRIMNDYDGVLHDYTRKKGLVWEQVFLPENAPLEWADRNKLWNAVEGAEKTKDSRLARELVVALPVELDKIGGINLLTEYIKSNFISEGMCADVAIHNTDGHNPHAHILLTVRPLDSKGRWQHKTEKEYLCKRNGEEKGFTATEFLLAKENGWEKQYPYSVNGKKIYMTPSEAEIFGYTRASKYPKSTRYGRQNPITTRWNSEEQLQKWREQWAVITNKYLDRVGAKAHIDHRSHKERGLDEQPTIHEGITARTIEKAGYISDRCEINRQIKADNALLRELKATVKKISQAVKDTLPLLAEAMESLRQSVLLFSYRILDIHIGKRKITDYFKSAKPALEQYKGIVNTITDKTEQRNTLLDEKKETPKLQLAKHRDLSRRIAELTEEIEELKSEKARLLASLECADDKGIFPVQREISKLENTLKRLEQQEKKYQAELNKVLTQYAEYKEQAKQFDAGQFGSERLRIRPQKEDEVRRKIEADPNLKYEPLTMLDSRNDTDYLLGYDIDKNAVWKYELKKRKEAVAKKHSNRSKEHNEPER